MKTFRCSVGGSLTKLGVNGGLVASAGFSLSYRLQAPVSGAGLGTYVLKVNMKPVGVADCTFALMAITLYL